MFKPLLATLMLLIAAAPADPAHPAALVGEYDGHQMEMAAGLELKADGRFQYGLSYGALDEEAEGNWMADQGSVVLTSDHVTPPRFTPVEQKAGPAQELRIAIDVPHGMNPQYFNAVVIFADGHAVQEQLSEDEKVIPLANGAMPTRVMIVLSIFDLHGDWVAIDLAKGNRLRFGFEANDLGKVDFHGAVLKDEGGVLLLDRHGRTISFRRVHRQG
ncbi:MAG: hypothetical protein JWL96_2133 [Sphingomonas bacterium]|uniref:hypothetical protein n=1 Tax=Sphingomonas bacterium TaxID=1895847 RepID=UPI002603731C|nr:hypothetical protein [Sphingomonas bacterium]MDB5710063.1 hypothetical protein [Sphingomonas bacterium]